MSKTRPPIKHQTKDLKSPFAERVRIVKKVRLNVPDPDFREEQFKPRVPGSPHPKGMER